MNLNLNLFLTSFESFIFMFSLYFIRILVVQHFYSSDGPYTNNG